MMDVGAFEFLMFCTNLKIPYVTKNIIKCVILQRIGTSGVENKHYFAGRKTKIWMMK